jgi:predicted Zn-dependent protease
MARIALPRMAVASAFLLCALTAQAQIPGIFQDLLRAIPKPAPERSQAAPQPGLLSTTSLDEELRIGRQLAGDLLGAVALSKDAKLQRYVNKVGRWVATQSDRPDLKWYFGVLESDDVNAFALPGGYVFLTKGLLALLSTEAELAGVLGHEIAHVMLQHHLKVLKKSQMVDAASGFVGQQVAGDSMIARGMLGKGAEAVARGLDKSAEYEADRVGVVLATRAGYSPYGLPTALRKIGARNPREGSVALLFKTHPLPQDRLEHLGDAMGDRFDQYADGKELPERFARPD